MKHNLSTYIILTVCFFSVALTSCASQGKLSLVDRNETNALLDDLLTHTEQYTVHYHGNTQKLVSGILFDPKDDNRYIRPEGALWRDVTDAQVIASIVDIILTSNEPKYFPNVYRVTDPEGNYYGYLITGWTGLVIKPVDEQTLKVYGLRGPPEYEDRLPGGR
jgi:hypothetical protein